MSSTRRFATNANQATSTGNSLLMTPAQVKGLPAGKTRILDCTWFMPNSPRNAKEEFSKQHIAGAKYFDLDEVASEHPLGLKHMMPSPEQFRDACNSLGITRDHTVVLYDTLGIFSAPRALFTFKAFGHPSAFVLNGGLPAWREELLPVEAAQYDAGTEDLASGDLADRGKDLPYPLSPMNNGVIRSFDDMLKNTLMGAKEADLVLDARPNARFTGTAPEPRPGLSSGHMEHSVSIPFSALLATHEGRLGPYMTLLSANELKQAMVNLLDSSGRNGEETLERILGGEQGVVASCGSGMTAAVIWLALQELGANNIVPLFDESWTGWALRGAPIIRDGNPDSASSV